MGFRVSPPGSEQMKRILWLALFTILPPVSQAEQNRSSSKPMTETEKAGEKLFFQRCSVCHLGIPPRYPTYGPLLDQQLVASRGEDAVRNRIMEGSPKMPAWKYTLKPSDVDNIISYLKTVPKQAVSRPRSNPGPEEQVGGD